jgi:hypothetical protein
MESETEAAARSGRSEAATAADDLLRAVARGGVL